MSDLFIPVYSVYNQLLGSPFLDRYKEAVEGVHAIIQSWLLSSLELLFLRSFYLSIRTKIATILYIYIYIYIFNSSLFTV